MLVSLFFAICTLINKSTRPWPDPETVLDGTAKVRQFSRKPLPVIDDLITE